MKGTKQANPKVRVGGKAFKSARPVHDARRARLAGVEEHEPAGMNDAESLAEDAAEMGGVLVSNNQARGPF